MLFHLFNVLFCLIFVTIVFVLTNAAPTDSINNNKSTTANIIAIEPENTSSSTPLFEISRKKATTITALIDTNENLQEKQKREKEDEIDEDSSEIYELKLKSKKVQNKTKKKNPPKKKDEDSEDLLSEFSQGYKKVYSKISHWWRDLESSFAVTPISYEGPSKKVKKDSSSFEAQHKSKNKGTTKKPPVNKKKPPPPKKKDQKQKESESWFDWNKVILVLGGIVTVLDLFGIR